MRSLQSFLKHLDACGIVVSEVVVEHLTHGYEASQHARRQYAHLLMKELGT